MSRSRPFRHTAGYCCLCALIVLAGSGRPAMSQCEPLGQINGTIPDAFLGYEMDTLSDTDGDGVREIIATDPFTGNGRAIVYSGRTGEVIHEKTGESPGDFFGADVSNLGDLDQDGIDDFGVTANYWPDGDLRGRAYLYSGLDGTLIRTFEGENSGDVLGTIAGVGDLTGDGIPEIALGAFAADTSSGAPDGVVWVRSGADWTLVHMWEGDNPLSTDGSQFGGNIVAIGDLTGDGVSEIAVSAVRYFVSGLGTQTGSVTLFSGRTGSLVRSLFGTDAGGLFGGSIFNASDLNGDGVDEIGISAQWARVGNFDKAGKVYVFSGDDQTVFRTWSGISTFESFGLQAENVGDFNGDGVDDTMISAPYYSSSRGRAHVYSGADGSQICRWDGSSGSDIFGSDIAAMGDINHDGYPDVASSTLGEDTDGLSNNGAVTMYAGGCSSFALLVGDLRWREIARLKADCAPADTLIHFVYSLRGPGSTYIPPLDLTLDLDSPRLAGSARSDSAGRALIAIQLPDRSGPLPLWLQAAAQGQKSGVVRRLIID